MRRKFALLLLIVVPAYAPRYTSENYYPKENDPEEVGLHMKQADEHYRKGGQFAREGDWSNAQKHYRLVTALAPGMVDNYVRLAYALRENGMRTEAMAIAMHGLREKVNPALKDRYDLRSLRGEMLVEDGKVAEAAREYRRTRFMMPWLVEANTNAGTVLKYGGYLEEAKVAYARAAQLAPKSVEPFAELGALHARLGARGPSLDAWARAAKLAPSDASHALELGHAFTAVERHGEAQHALGRALALAPSHAAGYFSIGEAWRALRRPRDALGAFAVAATLAPTDGDVAFAAGLAARAAGDGSGSSEEAVGWWRRAQSVAPQRSDVLTFLRSAEAAEAGWPPPAEAADDDDDDGDGGGDGGGGGVGGGGGGGAAAKRRGKRHDPAAALRVSANDGDGWERRAARLLRSQGAAIITDVLAPELGAALHSQLGKAAKAAARGGSDSGGRTVATSRTFESNKREHFGVSLRAAAARATVDALASALHPVLSRALGLGGDAIIRLVESGCIVAEGGAIRQRVHTDTAGAAAAAAGAEAIALKIQVGAVNITTRMGAIEIEPASHFDAAAPGAARRPDADDAADEYPLVSLPIPAGGVAIYDTRLRHRGGANRAGKRRAVFYVTVVGAGALPVGLPYVIEPDDAGCFALTPDGADDSRCGKGAV